MAIPAIKNEETIKVYQLFYQRQLARPEAIPCSELMVLQHQAVQIILNSKKLDSCFQLVIEKLVEQGLHPNFGRIMETFRMAQARQEEPLGFDLWWDEEPMVLL